MSSSLANAATALVIPAVILFHLYAAPFTKIEEDFNIQATHDLLTYGVPRSYDTVAQHFEHALYPGPVPRTFVGPLALAAASYPLDWYLQSTTPYPDVLYVGQTRQTIVRAMLGVYNALGILYFRSMVKRLYGQTAAHWFSGFSATQFHVMFYASRTLPNFFVYGGCAVALAELLPFQTTGAPLELRSGWRARRGMALLTVLGIVFRSEIAVLLAAHVLVLVLMRRVGFMDLVVAGALGVVVGLGLTVPVDSFFWNKYPEWPELTSFIFNVVQGKSSDWGVSPFHYYFSSALPRLLLSPALYLVCIPTALFQPALRSSAAQMLAPSLIFVLLYSVLPHKERRFIIYILPPLTAAAAAGAAWLWNRRQQSRMYQATAGMLVLSVAAAFAGNLVMLAVSTQNYPGGHAMLALHRVASSTLNPVNVHMDTLSIMTGATRFMELGAPRAADAAAPQPPAPQQWLYDRSEQRDKTGNLTFWNSFDYALAELPERVAGEWEVLAVVEGFAGVQLLQPGDSARQRPWRFARRLQHFVRRHVARGRWAQIRMRPLIHVLRNRRRS